MLCTTFRTTLRRFQANATGSFESNSSPQETEDEHIDTTGNATDSFPDSLREEHDIFDNQVLE